MSETVCSVENCGRVAVTRGWCQAHYLRWRRTGDVSPARRIGEQRNRHCEAAGCVRPAITKGLCTAHYGRLRRTGSIDDARPIRDRPPPKKCEVENCDNPSTEHGLCHGHYLRTVRHGDVLADRPLRRRVNFECAVDGCQRLAELRGLCRTHANRKRKFGDVQADKPIRDVPGTGYVNHGYRIVPVPPELRHLVGGDAGAAEHRLEMAKLLGRPLRNDESVHHINGNRLENRTDGPLRNFRSGNLELWSRWQPSGQRVTDKIEYAIDLLHQYLPDALAKQLPLALPQSDRDDGAAPIL